jgi:hypothetical protein
MTHTHANLTPTRSITSIAALFHRIWPAAVIVLGLVLNLAWIVMLGYGLVSFVALAF